MKDALFYNFASILFLPYYLSNFEYSTLINEQVPAIYVPMYMKKLKRSKS